MGIFSKPKPEAPAKPAGELEERVRKLESVCRQLELDLLDLFDRQRRLQGRDAKRQQADIPKLDPVEALNEQIRRDRAGMIPLNGA